MPLNPGQHPTEFFYSLGSALNMTFDPPRQYIDGTAEPLFELVEDSETAHDLLHQFLDDPSTAMLFLDDQVWALALRKALRAADVPHLFVWDTGEDGWASYGTNASPNNVILTPLAVADIAQDHADLLGVPVELHLTVEEALGLAVASMSGYRIDDGWLWHGLDDGNATHVGYIAPTRLAAQVMRNALISAGSDAFIVTEQTSLTDGTPYVHHVVAVPMPDVVAHLSN